MSYFTARQRIWELTEPAAPGDRLGQFYDIGMITLILLNVVSLIIATMESVWTRFGAFLTWFEVFSVLVFTADYLARLWACRASPVWGGGKHGRIRFAFTPMAIIDLLSVLPFYLAFLTFDLRVLRVLRLFRIFRIIRLFRYSDSLELMGRTFRNKREELVITGAVVMALLIISSTLIYHAEREFQPEYYGSIPEAMWWSIVTLTTVGYGDVYPVSPLGKTLAAFVAVLGIGLFALPAGILGAGFTEEIALRNKRRRADDGEGEGAPDVCPHCGLVLSGHKDSGGG